MVGLKASWLALAKKSCDRRPHRPHLYKNRKGRPASSASEQVFVSAFFFALIQAGMGDNDEAFHLLDKAFEERFNRLAYLSVEALWDPLRSDPRFAELLRRIAVPELKLLRR
jgi:hypothetical protein